MSNEGEQVTPTEAVCLTQHYLMRQCNGVGGWVRLEYRLCRRRCSCGCEMGRYKNVKVRNVRVRNPQSDEGKDWRLHPRLSSMAPRYSTLFLS